LDPFGYWTPGYEQAEDYMSGEPGDWERPMIWAAVGVMAFLLTRPIFDVAMVFIAAEYETLKAFLFFGYTSVDRYMLVLQRPKLTNLDSTEYAWAALLLQLVVPIAVLKDHAERFGIFGAAWRTWCVAFHHTLFLLVPDVTKMAWRSAWKYDRAYGEAALAILRRAFLKWCTGCI
jgi:hypothetical protein